MTRSPAERNSPSKSPTRREVLGGIAGFGAGRSLRSLAAAAPTLTVMTRNLYVGVDVTRLFRVRTMADVRHIAGQLLAEVETHPYAARAEAIAAEVAATDPDVVGLQEAALIRTQRPSDFADDPTRNATDVTVDLLDLVASKLDAQGLNYEVAGSTVNTDLEVPADVGDDQVDVRITDRTALLVHEDVEATDVRTGTFEAALSVPIENTAISIRRGYCVADVAVEGTDLTVATTHLEASSSGPRQQQAEELLELLPADRPVVLAGDFNSGPGGATGAYDSLTESFDDAHATLRPDEDGFTCCQQADLRNAESQLTRRIDGVLARGGLDPVAVERVGAAPADRVAATVDGESARLWPSDHAGVVATFDGAPSDGETSPPLGQASANESPPDDERNVPLVGFGSAAAVVAVVIAALVRRNRDE